MHTERLVYLAITVALASALITTIGTLIVVLSGATPEWLVLTTAFGLAICVVVWVIVITMLITGDD